MNANLNTISSWEEVPLFDSEQAEALFWSENRPDARLMEGAVSAANETSESVAISLRIDPRMLSRMKRLARSRFLNYQSMMKQWLSERMELEMNNDTQMKNQNRNRQASGFTLIEMLVVIAIIGILAGILTVGATAAVRKNKLTRVTVELRQLETAIESYKADKGYYPPDNGLPPVIVGKPFQAPDTERTNTLYYELSGMTLTANGGYQTLDGQETLAGPLASLQSALTNTFGLNNFHNAGAAGAAARQADDAPIAKSFIKFKANQTATFSEPVKTGNYTFRVLNVPVEGGDKSDFNPWRYNSHNPTNNPDSYDLWAEFLIGSKTNIICNWSHNVIAK